ncbi:hypothetical protein [Paenibacillus albus]|uniref:hypothetical protein n=1 Tax=Paenibacillus albus TaxID=2495582 RepID=UPI0013DFB289|nr:hypothetical protein [Paenibacillus albus]
MSKPKKASLWGVEATQEVSDLLDELYTNLHEFTSTNMPDIFNPEENQEKV